jgi:hypothetical protein
MGLSPCAPLSRILSCVQGPTLIPGLGRVACPLMTQSGHRHFDLLRCLPVGGSEGEQHIENTEGRIAYSVIFFGIVDGKHVSRVAALFRRLFVDSQYSRA